MPVNGLVAAAVALALSSLCVAGLRRWAAERMLDIPNVRSSHTRPTPRGGGLGIVIAVLIGTWGLCVFRISSIPFGEIAALSLAGVLVALGGWFDDIRPLPYRVRLVVQVISAALVLAAIGYFRAVAVPFVGVIRLNLIGLPLTLLWIVGLTNAYNFMDGIDGIAGGQAVVAGLGWATIGFLSGQSFVSMVGILLAAASLGFLFFNWPPARIFMGDVGSAFIGLILAVLPVIGAKRDPLLVVAGFLVVWPFVLDTIFTFFRRLTRGENIFLAHRSHIYQRLVIAGYSHRFVTLLYIGLAWTGATGAWLWQTKSSFVKTVVILLPFLLFCGLWWLTLRAESRVHSVAA